MCQKSKLKSQQVKTPPTNKFRLKLNQANKFNKKIQNFIIPNRIKTNTSVTKQSERTNNKNGKH